MLKTVVAGVDPGCTGAIALVSIDSLEIAGVIDLPVIQYATGGGGKRKRLDEEKLLKIIQSLSRSKKFSVAFWIIESQQFFPSACSKMFTFRIGHCYGLITGMIRSSFGSERLMSVKPMAWQQSLGLINKRSKRKSAIAKEKNQYSARKERSRQLALRLFPAAEPWLKRKQDHNRGEASLIAFNFIQHDLPKFMAGYKYGNGRDDDEPALL